MLRYILVIFAVGVLTSCAAEEPGVDDKSSTIPKEATSREVPLHPSNLLQSRKLFFFIKNDFGTEELVGEKLIYKNDRYYRETPIKCGKKHGLERTWHQNGIIMLETHYDDGLEDGLQKQYSDTGKFIGQYEMKHGTGTKKEWFNEGQLKSECEYKDGKKHGFYKTYFGNGQVGSEGHYLDGHEDGIQKSFYFDGKMMQIENYQGGQIHGILILRDKDGKIIEKDYIVHGKHVSRDEFIEAAKKDQTLNIIEDKNE